MQDLAEVLYAKPWAEARIRQLAAMQRIPPPGDIAKEELRKALGFFQTNAERMRYRKFRAQGLFVGSGVIEPGCKTIVGRRLKHPE